MAGRANNPEPTGQQVLEINQRFYDGLWSGARLVEPDRFNTWPIISPLARQAKFRLEAGPGLRPRLPVEGTFFADISTPALAALKRAGGQVVSAGITELPFPDNRFDLVCALDIIEHVEDDQAALAELVRVATPDARFLVSVPLHPELWTPFDNIVGHFRRYSPERLAGLLESHGLVVEQSAIFGMKPRSSRLLDLGMWFLENHPRVAIKVYNRILMPLGLRRQRPLELSPGMVDTRGVDEIFMVCRFSRSEPG